MEPDALDEECDDLPLQMDIGSKKYTVDNMIDELDCETSSESEYFTRPDDLYNINGRYVQKIIIIRFISAIKLFDFSVLLQLLRLKY